MYFKCTTVEPFYSGHHWDHHVSGIWRRPYFQGLPVEFPVGVATRIRAFQHDMATSLSTGSLRVRLLKPC